MRMEGIDTRASKLNLHAYYYGVNSIMALELAVEKEDMGVE